ncbi:divergent polysaccharide deacetylase family protein [Campylobacter sp. FMV-PI01]|uniref:Divergent polysaccharide deacetylase family protein n=1 Tax=Campylobacter portucalensis TaxID=2608384 RepID=A0A6L5WM13_9BACT|nr:divergent polysaccharide deacetylase family protein [Campylobacter portucalensis]MSN96721.1 divergent polysaccharide deacetylase family protein [Campylobacter portucalensis]
MYYVLDCWFLYNQQEEKTIKTQIHKSQAPKSKNIIKNLDIKMQTTNQDYTKILQPKKQKLEIPPQNNAIKTDSVQQTKSNKPKLVIIIDDVSLKSHVDEIKNINLKLTPSIFPPTKHHKNTPKFAKEFECFMIHLPLEAINFNSPEIGTLTTKSTKDEIEKTIKNIRKNFPNAKFINNHTGSKFTSDEKSMTMLFEALLKHDFIFLDSKTINTSKVKKVAQKFNQPYIVRDLFLDHENDIKAIKKKLKNSVEMAKKKGFAIVIGHPKSNTFKALKNSDEILKDVEVVYIKDLYEKY